MSEIASNSAARSRSRRSRSDGQTLVYRSLAQAGRPVKQGASALLALRL